MQLEIALTKEPRKSNRLDLVGRRFGRLKVLKLDHIKTDSYWLCECDCGKKVVIKGTNLNCGYTKSCGCLQREKASEIGRRKKRGVKNAC